MSRLNARDEAFLAEMGIAPLWTLRSAPAGAEPTNEALAPQEAAQPAQAFAPPDEAAQTAPPQANPAAPPRSATAPAANAAWDDAAHPAAPVNARDVAARAPAPAPARDGAAAAEPDSTIAPGDEQIAGMDWAQLHAAIASCTRCGACKAGHKPVFGAGAQRASWFVVAGASTAADEAAGQPLAGDTGKLLDNMLAAVDLSRAQDVYITNLVKCRPMSAKGGDRAPAAEEAAACRPYLERELALTGAGTVLTLGQIAADGLLGKPLSEPLAGSRGAVHELAGVPLVATLHPGELLRRGADKALAWSDLCRARAAARARPG
jgi:DNA polymerase